MSRDRETDKPGRHRSEDHDGERLLIAVADDHAESREGLERALRLLGHEVMAADGGKALVEMARQRRPDLVITDILMPGLDGIEAAAAITREGAVPVILVSGHHDPGLVDRAAAANVMTYLVKPINLADLQTAVPLAMARFAQLRTLAEETASLRQSLEDRKLVEKAKGILMKRLRVEEYDAFRKLRTFASTHNAKLVAVARQVITADEVFGQLEDGR
jgi:response regulator NasT